MWDGHLAAQGARLIAARVALVNMLAPEVEKAYQLLAPASWPAPSGTAVRWRRSRPKPRRAPSIVEVFEVGLLDELARKRSAELERGVCLVGPHRDDLELRLGDEPAKALQATASLGRWRCRCVGGLRTASVRGSASGVLLDDVFAELDNARRRALVEVAASADRFW